MRKQKGLSPWLLIFLGGIIAAYASFISTRLDGSSVAMQLFIYAGLVICALGVGKIGVRWWQQKGKQGEERIAERIAGVPTARPQIIHCNQCKAKNYSTSNFCHMCGKKLK